MKQTTKRSSRGFTLLLAVLAASIALVLGTSIFEISTKEVQLSGLGRDSEYAFYTADSAAECTLYWDFQYNYFGTTTPSGLPPGAPKCDNQSLAANIGMNGRTSSYPQVMNFQYEPNGHCVNVSVHKCDGTFSTDGTLTCTSISPVPPATQTPTRTVIHADGFNTPCSGITGPTALQRSVELSY